MGAVNGFGFTGFGRMSVSGITGLRPGYSYAAKAKSSSQNKKPKQLQYNFKEISSQILRAKTSLGARVVSIRARGKVALLLRQVGTGTYDSKELDGAITHARAMERIAKKRLKHLLSEEKAAQKNQHNGSQIEWEETEDMEEMSAEDMESQKEDAKLSEEELERLMQELMQEMEMLMMEMQESADEMSGMEELSEELMAVVSEDAEPEDLERQKKKHRSDEMKDIVEADMRYLRALFDKLAREKAAVTSGAKILESLSSSGNSGRASGRALSGAGVSLELGGIDMSADIATMTCESSPVFGEGAMVDVAV